MFRLLLKLLGLEQYEYPENSGLIKSDNQSSTIKPQAEAKPEPKPKPKQEKINSEPKQETEIKAEPKQKSGVKAEPVAASNILTAEMLVENYAGLKSNYAKMLIEAGFDSLAKIEHASDKELLAIKGIGKATAKLLK
jgi:hypothetical protein